MKERALLKTSSKTRQYLRYAKRNNNLGDTTPMWGNSKREDILLQKNGRARARVGLLFFSDLATRSLRTIPLSISVPKDGSKKPGGQNHPRTGLLRAPGIRRWDAPSDRRRCSSTTEEEENEDPPESSAPCFPLIPTSVWSPSRGRKRKRGRGGWEHGP